MSSTTPLTDVLIKDMPVFGTSQLISWIDRAIDTVRTLERTATELQEHLTRFNEERKRQTTKAEQAETEAIELRKIHNKTLIALFKAKAENEKLKDLLAEAIRALAT